MKKDKKILSSTLPLNFMVFASFRKLYICCSLLIGLFSFSKGWVEPLQVEILGEAALLMNAETGAILFEKDAYSLRYPASTTKIATALYTLQLKGNDLDGIIAAQNDCLVTLTQEAKRKSNYTVPDYWLEPDGTHMSLLKNEEMSLRDLLKGLLIVSANDAANVIAQSLGGTIPKFMEGLNAYVKEIGCHNTHFRNPHGLHHPQHQTTAYDLALLGQEALKNPILCDIVSQAYFKRPKTNLQKPVTLLQGNALMRSGKWRYSKAIGIKTGYHAKAKSTFVGAARHGNRTLIVVLLGYQKRAELFADAIKLFDLAFNQPLVQRHFLKAGPQSFQCDLALADRSIKTYLKDNLSLSYYPAEDPRPKCLLYWHALTLPIQKGQEVGELHLVAAKGEVLKKIPLFAQEAVKFKWPYRWFLAIQTRWGDSPLFALVVGLSLLTTIYLSIVYCLRRR